MLRGAEKSTKRPARAAAPETADKPIGEVTHFYGDIKVAVAKFSAPPAVGTLVRFKGATTDFCQTIYSVQYEHKPIQKIPKGKHVGIKVSKRVRPGDLVYA